MNIKNMLLIGLSCLLCCVSCKDKMPPKIASTPRTSDWIANMDADWVRTANAKVYPASWNGKNCYILYKGSASYQTNESADNNGAGKGQTYPFLPDTLRNNAIQVRGQVVLYIEGSATGYKGATHYTRTLFIEDGEIEMPDAAANVIIAGPFKFADVLKERNLLSDTLK